MSSIEAGYAEALLKASAQRSTKRVADELFVLSKIAKSRPGFFFNPRIRSDQHVAALSALSDVFDPLTLQFAMLLASRRLLKALPAIQLHFDDLARRDAGDVKIRLRVPYELESRLLGELTDFLAEAGLFPPEKRESAQLNVMLDKSLIGGFYAEYNGRVIDASLKHRLDESKQKRGALNYVD